MKRTENQRKSVTKLKKKAKPTMPRKPGRTPQNKVPSDCRRRLTQYFVVAPLCRRPNVRPA